MNAQTNVLIAGWDDDTGPSLYFLDYLATLHKQNTAAHGYGAFFSLALMDKSWSPGMTMDEGATNGVGFAPAWLPLPAPAGHAKPETRFRIRLLNPCVAFLLCA